MMYSGVHVYSVHYNSRRKENNIFIARNTSRYRSDTSLVAAHGSTLIHLPTVLVCSKLEK